MKNVRDDQQVQNYLNTVVEQIRFTEAREGIRRELLSHIEDGIESAGKVDPQERDQAVRRVIQGMGDPNEIAGRLDRIHRPRMDFLLVSLTGLASFLGLFVLGLSGWGQLQVLWMAIGLIVTGLIWKSSYRSLSLILASLYPLSFVGLLAAQFSGISFDGQPYLSLLGLKIKIVDVAALFMALSLPAIAQCIPFKRVRAVGLLLLSLAPVIYFATSGSILPAVAILMAGVISIHHLKPRLPIALGLGVFGVATILGGIDKTTFLEATPALVARDGHTDFALMLASQHSHFLALFISTVLISLVIHLFSSVGSIRTPWLRATAIISAAVFSLEILLGVGANYGFTPMVRSGISLPFVSYGGSLIVAHFLMIGATLACLKRRTVQYF